MVSPLVAPPRGHCLALAFLTLTAGLFAGAEPPEPGLLFRLSGDQGTTADFSAGGTAKPNVVSEVSIIHDGAKGPGLRCADVQLLSYWAPGNIYAQRGTLSFFWRSRDPVGPTAFPIFRVAYADHSSWDMVWLRIDYNGHGFDAFVTDANLARTRVSCALPEFPKPSEWTHLALAWDETSGIQFFINGKLAAENKTAAVYDAALDQFGPHSRIISPHQVQSDYNFVRGGDIDEVMIYDHALQSAEIGTLAKGLGLARISAPPTRNLREPRWRDEWWLRFGWNRPDNPPLPLTAPNVTVRKVEIHDAYDLKRWWWKANDGIRETTWPGVYNRSRLPGRNDYFQLPDWDCYSLSGKTVTFTLPDEPWNHLEIVGSAWGKLIVTPPAGSSGSAIPTTELTRPKGQEITFHQLSAPISGGRVTFENAAQEEPIAEFGAYYIHPGEPPSGPPTLSYTLAAGNPEDDSIDPLLTFIEGRYPPEERQILVAQPTEPETPAPRNMNVVNGPGRSLPIVHILIPTGGGSDSHNLERVDGGLDGIVLHLPGLEVRPTHGQLFPLNVRVKDPLWPLRDMLDVTFSVKPGQPVSLWLDTRDRILPPGKPLYLTVAGAGQDFSRHSLEGASLQLVFKPKEAARAEHEIDRFTQARDSYAMLVEEHPHDARFNLWNRFEADIKDLLRVNPEHPLGVKYAAAAAVRGYPRPPYTPPSTPEGVPTWAYRQVQVLEAAKRFVLWYIDHRQIENGEFGGGISDDTDLLNLWPGLALMGAEPEKIQSSLHRLLEAAFANGMFTNGLPTIQTDELHSYEEGINALSQNLILDYGNPLQLERAMATARGVIGITGINRAGHRHIRSSYYSGSRIAEDSVWGYAKGYSYLVLQPGMLLADYNGAPVFRKASLELADGLIAHRKVRSDGRVGLPKAIHFSDDQDVDSGRFYFPWHVFWEAYRWTGDRKYLDPFFDQGPQAIAAINADAIDQLQLRKEWASRDNLRNDTRPLESRARGDVRGPRSRGNDGRDTDASHFEWQLSGDKKYLEDLYGRQLERIALTDYINTEGSLWIDRVSVPTAEIQRARLGGIALVRNALIPGHVVSWRFHAPATEQSLGILIPVATPEEFKVIAFNLDTEPVSADMTGWGVEAGTWEYTQGVDTTGKDTADKDIVTRTALFERSRSVTLTFPPRATTVLVFKRIGAGAPTESRPDLGISKDDVTVTDGALHLRVHSLGAKPTPASRVVAATSDGKLVGTADIPALEAPSDLQPRVREIEIRLPEGTAHEHGTVTLNPDARFEEITRMNNVVAW
ncbi:hypothetical protein DB347_17380 [Opitutaceae bacterium EW11]|nr:hypothetical protein DB347_17380 [Opitutaceae bacterium EW11]